jgi:hypothetical protein
MWQQQWPAMDSSPRGEILRVRLNREEAALLSRLERESKRSKSEIVREGIQRMARDRVFETWLQDARRHGRAREPKFEGR